MDRSKEQIPYSQHASLNERIDDRLEDAKFSDFGLKPSDTLYKLSYEQDYLPLIEEEKQSVQEELEENIIQSFPTIIADPFKRFKSGADHETERFGYMRDTWEMSVLFLYVFILSQARLYDLETPKKYRALFSDKVNDRCQTIDKLSKELELKCLELDQENESKIFARVKEAGEYIKELNQIRNDFFHDFTPTESQAKETIEEIRELFYNFLLKIDFVSEIKIVCFNKYLASPCNIECDQFIGASCARDYVEFGIDDDCERRNRSAFEQKSTFLLFGKEISLIAPFIRITKIAGSPDSHILLLKQVKGGPGQKEFKYQNLVTREKQEFAQETLQNHIDYWEVE